MEKYIITGGPCTGKTTMLEQIAQKGFKKIEECAREIIQEEEAKIKQGYKGIFPCFFGGRTSRLLHMISRASIRRGLVSLGTMTASTKPRPAAQ